MAETLEANEPEAIEPAQTPTSLGLLRIAWRRKTLVALGVVVGLVLGVLYYAQATPVYQSTAQVLVVKKRPDMVAGADTRLSYFEDYVATHQVLIKSSSIVEQAVNKRGLQSLRSLAGSQAEPTEGIIKALAVSRASRESGGNLNNVLTLSWRGKVREECGTVLTAVIDSYKDFLDETYRNVTDDTVKLITQARDELIKNRAAKQKAYDEFLEVAPLVTAKGKDGGSLYLERLSAIEGEQLALLVRRAKVEGQLVAIERALTDGRSREALLAMLIEPSRGAAAAAGPESAGRVPAETARRGSPSALADALVPLLLQEQLLLEDYGPAHPQVQAIRKRIELARELIARPSAVWGKPAGLPEKDEAPRTGDPAEWLVAYLKLDLDQIREAERRLDDDCAREYEKAQKLKKYATQEARFQRDLADSEKMVEEISKRLQSAGLVKDFGGYDARVIASPTAGKKVEPNVLVVFPLAALFGLLGGLGLAYVAEVSDKSFRTPEEIRRRLGLPVVGHIPFLKLSEKELQKANGACLDPMLCTHYRSQSPEAEAFRGLRTALYFSTRGSGHKVIQVTSPDAGDGKTTLAANLAVSIAQAGKKVLLIDADLRKPRLHKVFGLSSATGLSSVIAGEEELQDAIQQSAVPRLWLLPSGPLPHNPAELLTSPHFKAILDSIREHTKFYDFVLIDTPPLLAVTDPCVVAPHVDGVLLTIRISKNGRPHAERAKEILGTLGAKILGVVVNGVSQHGSGAYGYGDYRYGYGYATNYSNGEDGGGAPPVNGAVEAPGKPGEEAQPPALPS